MSFYDRSYQSSSWASFAACGGTCCGPGGTIYGILSLQVEESLIKAYEGCQYCTFLQFRLSSLNQEPYSRGGPTSFQQAIG